MVSFCGRNRRSRMPGLGARAQVCDRACDDLQPGCAALGGILIPLVLHRQFDPAVASSPFVTTVTDVVGFSRF